jgi:uncharacterized SAM-binding protein YcdF (DUF218 family)
MCLLDRSTKADVAILLGGNLNGESTRNGEPSLGAGADRVLQAARLYRAGQVRYILISAGNLPWQHAHLPEAEQIAHLLKEWGIPAEMLIIEMQSRNTYENAQRSKTNLGSLWLSLGPACDLCLSYAAGARGLSPGWI